MTPKKCRLCGNSDAKQSVRSSDVFGGSPEHNFWQCEFCDAIYLYPVVSEKDEKKFYLQEFETFMSSRAGDQRDWTNAEKHKKTNQDQVKRRMPFIEKYLKPGVDLLEIGCSTGFMLDAFKARGVNCVGIEPSGEFNDYLFEQGYEVYSQLDSIHDSHKFDIVTHFFVLEHIRDPFRFLTTIFSMLNEGGVMVCEVPCANDPLTSVYNIDAFESFYWSVAHHYYYTTKSLNFLLGKLGYSYKLVPEQRYDISNHMTWMIDGKPGGQGKYTNFLGQDIVDAYRKRMIDTWQCDTVFLYIWK